MARPSGKLTFLGKDFTGLFDYKILEQCILPEARFLSFVLVQQLNGGQGNDKKIPLLC
jgi:hypothetical protein